MNLRLTPQHGMHPIHIARKHRFKNFIPRHGTQHQTTNFPWSFCGVDGLEHDGGGSSGLEADDFDEVGHGAAAVVGIGVRVFGCSFSSSIISEDIGNHLDLKYTGPYLFGTINNPINRLPPPRLRMQIKQQHPIPRVVNTTLYNGCQQLTLFLGDIGIVYAGTVLDAPYPPPVGGIDAGGIGKVLAGGEVIVGKVFEGLLFGELNYGGESHVCMRSRLRQHIHNPIKPHHTHIRPITLLPKSFANHRAHSRHRKTFSAHHIRAV
mmetsp:Transcript_21144/g.38800  ORF Transcript_21144/g.38800 Transcript_21144/m.38800 type:complete len:264 (-) Transcript_21144:885-1676(-)